MCDQRYILPGDPDLVISLGSELLSFILSLVVDCFVYCQEVPNMETRATTNGSRPPTPRSERTTPRGETPQKQDCISRGVTPHGLVTDTAEVK